jgi:hypothetical protein
MIRAIVIVWTLICGYSLISAVGGLDSSMIESNDAYATGAGLGVLGSFVIWGIVVIPLSLVGLLFKK